MPTPTLPTVCPACYLARRAGVATVLSTASVRRPAGEHGPAHDATVHTLRCACGATFEASHKTP
jgi:hypothetical protein